ncbi:MAG: NifB/NifX family molybdenum-iron cluster-binding protein, partial [Thermodesulfobacteriota bacterium]|nr:NifB/NifX family molybdenum-iron cluster-binding protein [Thermodesulfobacteriota bacterium]
MIVVGLSLFLNAVAFAQFQQTQIIAVATSKKTESSQISDKAARASYYLIFDRHGKLLEIVSNPFCDDDRGAGPKVADLLASKNVSVVVAGDFGHKMKSALDKKKIDYHKTSGIIKNVVEDFIKSN